MTPPDPPPYHLVVKTSRSLSALLAGTVCLAALSGCASGEPAGQARSPETGQPSTRVQPATEIPVEATPVASRGWPFRLHTSTRSVFQVVSDPRKPARLWLGTEGGLDVYDAERGSWDRWTQADGLPAQQVRSLAIDGRMVHMVLSNGFGSFNRESRGLGVFDLQSSHFWSWSLRGEGVPQPLQGVRVLQQPGASGVVWWVVEQGLLRQDVASGFWTFFPAPGLPEPQPLVDGMMPGAGRIFVASKKEVWELRPARKEWRRVIGVDDLDRAATPRKDQNLPPSFQALSTEDGGETLWIGTYHGLFHVETKSGRVTWPEETRGEFDCKSRQVVRQGGRRLAYGNTCVREIGPAECCAVDHKQLWEIRDAFPDPRQPDLLWLATRRGLASLRLADGHVALHRPTGREPDGFDIMDLLAIDGRLWLAVTNADVSVLDLARKSWKTFPSAFNAGDFHRSSVNGNLLVVSGYRRLTWFDPRTAEQVPGPGSWPERPGWGMNLHHDERGLWGQGTPRQGFFLAQPDGTFRTVRAGPFGYRAHSLVPDRVHAGDFLVVYDKSLARIHPENGELEVLRPGVETIQLAGDRYLWIEGTPNARLDLRTGEVAALGLKGRLIPDPRHPDQAWLLQMNFLALYDVVRGERLAAITLAEDVISREVAVLGDHLWVGTNVGLLEIPLDRLEPVQGVLP